MNFTSFVRRPFLVEAVQITPENIDELALLLGEVKEKDGEKHILLDRRIVPNIKRAFVGWWVTKLDDNLRCYSPKVFDKEFTQYDDSWSAYFEQLAVYEQVDTTVQVGRYGRIVQEADPTPAEGTERPSEGLGLAVD